MATCTVLQFFRGHGVYTDQFNVTLSRDLCREITLSCQSVFIYHSVTVVTCLGAAHRRPIPTVTCCLGVCSRPRRTVGDFNFWLSYSLLLLTDTFSWTLQSGVDLWGCTVIWATRRLGDRRLGDKSKSLNLGQPHRPGSAHILARFIDASTTPTGKDWSVFEGDSMRHTSR